MSLEGAHRAGAASGDPSACTPRKGTRPRHQASAQPKPGVIAHTPARAFSPGVRPSKWARVICALCLAPCFAIPHLRYGRKDQHGFIEAIFELGSPPLAIALTARGAQGGVKSFASVVDSEFNGKIFFNSYFLDDGEYKLTISVTELNSGKVATTVNRIDIRNGSSDVSQLLRSEFRANPDLAIIVNSLDSSYFLPLPNTLQDSNYPLRHRNKISPRALSPQQISDFDSNGYIKLEGLFSKRIIEAARNSLNKVCATESHDFVRGSSNRIVNLHASLNSLNTIYSSKLIYDVVSDLFGCQAFPCQSLTFINGSTQDLIR
ncbi:hypothetical protein [Synechococcus sp. CBW1107]|uniref:hypothetical protein n=1 Tax=Synechococcus sp. CBW1107 TaxID=2789857 RepID=UPI002AD390D7|nr:hypothetical protein [Synechococcus sp. CBW1107]CAK6697533.1 hypothetical protein ICNINCKA_02247 [Synechococcus sp. CBW1107]